ISERDRRTCASERGAPALVCNCSSAEGEGGSTGGGEGRSAPSRGRQCADTAVAASAGPARNLDCDRRPQPWSSGVGVVAGRRGRRRQASSRFLACAKAEPKRRAVGGGEIA